MKSGTEGLFDREVSPLLSSRHMKLQGARFHRLSGVKVLKATGVLWPTQFILTVPLLARLSGIDGARADRADTLPGRTVPKLPEFSVLCNLSTYQGPVIQEV